MSEGVCGLDAPRRQSHPGLPRPGVPGNQSGTSVSSVSHESALFPGQECDTADWRGKRVRSETRRSHKSLIDISSFRLYVSHMETDAGEIRFEGCGDVVRAFRTEAELSLRELAERVGTSSANLCKIENDAISLPLTLIEKLAIALSIPSERVVLKCLERRFPKMRDTRAGRVVLKYLSTGETT